MHPQKEMTRNVDLRGIVFRLEDRYEDGWREFLVSVETQHSYRFPPVSA